MNQSCLGNFSEFRDQLLSLAFKYFYSFKPYKNISSVFKPSDFSLLKNFASNPDIVVLNLDKGKGVVIVDRHQYIIKCNEPNNFRPHLISGNC